MFNRESLLKERLKLYVSACCSCFVANNIKSSMFYYGKAEAVYDCLLIETLGECGSFEELFETLKDNEYENVRESHLRKALFEF